jgi:hypothetical protein
MKPVPDVLFRKICYILHRGFVESRLLALQAKHQQVFDLADALEPIPGFIPDWDEECLDVIRSSLRTYQNKYPPSAFDYLNVLDMDEQEFMGVLSQY